MDEASLQSNLYNVNIIMAMNCPPKTPESEEVAEQVETFVGGRIKASLPDSTGEVAIELNGTHGASTDEKIDIEHDKWTTEEYSKLALQISTMDEVSIIHDLCSRASLWIGPDKEAQGSLAYSKFFFSSSLKVSGVKIFNGSNLDVSIVPQIRAEPIGRVDIFRVQAYEMESLIPALQKRNIFRTSETNLYKSMNAYNNYTLCPWFVEGFLWNNNDLDRLAKLKAMSLAACQALLTLRKLFDLARELGGNKYEEPNKCSELVFSCVLNGDWAWLYCHYLIDENGTTNCYSKHCDMFLFTDWSEHEDRYLKFWLTKCNILKWARDRYEVDIKAAIKVIVDHYQANN